MSAFDDLFDAMCQGRAWDGMNKADQAKELLEEVYRDRFHSNDWGMFATRANLQTKASAASYAGYITADNPTSGGYSGTSFVWMPGEGGSVAVLVIGTQGFGSDAAILARPGHQRRLRALARLHDASVWVKPDLLDRSATVPEAVSSLWPNIGRALTAYADVIYAAVPVVDGRSKAAVEDLLALFFHEHRVRAKKSESTRWDRRKGEILGRIFPKLDEATVEMVLRERRFVVLEGPPGTGKTRAADRVAKMLGSHSVIQFHPARTYEDFVVGLAPRPTSDGLAFEVREGDLLRANRAAQAGPHTLVIDELNRADLAKVLGEAVYLLEVGDEDRVVDLPHPVGGQRELRLSPNLHILGTRNTADRSIARMDLAIRRRFAFLPMWPDIEPVREQGDPLALECFEDTLNTFTEACDDEGLSLVPGHAYFLDPRPKAEGAGRPMRIRSRLQYELLPLLDEYVEARLVGPATSDVQGLADRIRARLERSR